MSNCLDSVPEADAERLRQMLLPELEELFQTEVKEYRKRLAASRRLIPVHEGTLDQRMKGHGSRQILLRKQLDWTNAIGQVLHQRFIKRASWVRKIREEL